MTTGGYYTGGNYMGYDSKNNRYLKFETEAAYYEWVKEQEEEEANERSGR